MYTMFVKLLNMSMAASILAIVVMLLRIVLKKVPKKYICILWAFVALRLLCPVSISSSLSAYNALHVETDSAGQLQYFQYNEKSEKPKLIFETPVLADDDMSADSMTVQTHTSDLYLPVILYIWMFGVAVMMIYTSISYVRLKKRTAASILYRDKIYVCDDISSPFILGFVCPHIYLPAGLDEHTKINVIAHEQAHLQRHDHWWKPLGYFLLSLHWFNPVLWASYIFLCRDIEAACDEKVVDGMDKEGVVEYTMAMLACASQRRFITACPIAFGETNVKGRVKNVLNYKKPALWIVLIAVAACVAVAVCFLTDPQKETPAGTETPSTRVVQAVVTAIGGNTMLVRPVDGSWELNSSDVFNVSMEKMDESQEPELGDTIEIMYGGTIAEVYPAELENIMHIRVVSKAEPEVSSIEKEEEQPPAPYQIAETVLFSPDEVHDVERAEIHENYGDFEILDPEKLNWLENVLQDAKETTPTGCSFGTVIYIHRKDGTIGTIEPAEDGCKIFRSGEKYYEINVDSTAIFEAFGIEPWSSKVETTTEGDKRVVTIKHYSWYREDGNPTVAVFDKNGNMISRETQGIKEIYEYENGICVGWKEYTMGEDNVYPETPSRTFFYEYDRGGNGLISTVRDDEDGNHDVFAFEGSSEREELLQAVNDFVDDLPKAEKDSIINRSSPYIARVAPPSTDNIGLADGYEMNEYSLTRLVYMVVFQTEAKIPGPITIYVDSLGTVMGFEYRE